MSAQQWSPSRPTSRRVFPWIRARLESPSTGVSCGFLGCCYDSRLRNKDDKQRMTNKERRRGRRGSDRSVNGDITATCLETDRPDSGEGSSRVRLSKLGAFQPVMATAINMAWPNVATCVRLTQLQRWLISSSTLRLVMETQINTARFERRSSWTKNQMS